MISGNFNLQKKVLFILVLFLFLGVSGCEKHQITDQTASCKPIHFNDGWFENGVEGEDTRVLSYRLEGNCLYLTVGFGGGCKEHDIQMAATGWIKTYPPQIIARLVHDDQDNCEAYIKIETGFDLGSLNYTEDFYINIEGFDEKIYFKGY